MPKTIKRKPGIDRVSGTNEVKSMHINDCIDFTIQNVGTSVIYFGFRKDQQPDIPLSPNEQSPWPLYRRHEEWDGEIFIKFGNTVGVALLFKTEKNN